MRQAAAIAIGLWILCPGTGSAQTDDTSDEAPTGDRRDAEARAFFQAGSIAYDDGRYDDALRSFQRAYELSQRPQLLYNMGQCADRLRQDAEALDYLTRYLEAVPDAPDRNAIERRLAVLRVSAENAARNSEPESTPAPVVPSEPVDAGSESGSKWWLWTIIGVVVVGAAVGVGVALANRDPAYADPVPGDVGPGGIIQALRF